MESVAHGIGVKNRYALFYDEDLDPLEILRQQEEEKQKRKTDKTQSKDKSKVTKSNKQSVTTPSPKKPFENTAVKANKAPESLDSANKSKAKAPVDRFQKTYGNNQEFKDFEDRKNTRNKDDQSFNIEHKGESEFRRGRGGARGRGGRERGRGFYGSAENRGRRIFDRHSGSDKTGVRPVDKREGAGSNNWGDIRSDINQRKDDVWEEDFDASGDQGRDTSWGEDESNEKKEETKTSEGFVDNTDTKENEPLPEEPAEEIVKEMTLDEWKKEQEAKRAVPKYNLRKPGEGEDDKQWKKGYVLKKKAKEEDDDQDEDDDEEEDFNRKAAHRQLLDIQINFNDSRRGARGRGRGGRGAPRTGGRDAPREDRGNRGGRIGGRDPPKAKGQQSAPRVDDFNDFPSLVNA